MSRLRGLWSHEATSALIDAFKEHPCLHYRRRFVDSNDVKFANQTIQMKLDSLGYKFTLSEIVKKMTNLQIYYHQLRLKPRHEIGWSYFNKLAFLEKKYTTFDHTKERKPLSPVIDPNNNNPNEKCRETEQQSFDDHDRSIDDESFLSTYDQDDEETFTGVPSMVSPRKDHSALLQSSIDLSISNREPSTIEISNDDKYIQQDENDNNQTTKTASIEFEDGTSTKLPKAEDTSPTEIIIEIDEENIVYPPSESPPVIPVSGTRTEPMSDFRKPSDPKKDMAQTKDKENSLTINDTASFPDREHSKIRKDNNKERRESMERRSTYHAQQTSNANGDEDDHYGWSISNMMRSIPDCDEKRRLKYEIHENIKRVHHYIISHKIPYSSQHHYPPYYQHPSPPLIGQSPFHVISPEPLIGQPPYHVISHEPGVGETPQHFYYHQPSYESRIIVGNNPPQSKKPQHRRSPYKKPAKR